LKGVTVTLCACAALAVGAAVSLGQGSTSDDALRACVLKKSGAVRLVAAGGRCRRGERVVTWNIRGRAGTAGAEGTRGAQGGAGPTGARGAAGTFDFDSFDGMECDAGSGADTVDVTYDSDGFATFTC
jgi:hypothetical protein